MSDTDNQNLNQVENEESIQHPGTTEEMIESLETNPEAPEQELKQETLENKVTLAQAEIDDWKQKATRLAADLQNVQRQHELDLIQAKKSAKKSTITNILSFLNTLHLAFTFAPQSEDPNITSFIQTLKGSFEKVMDDLKSTGIEVIIPNIGDEFNPEYMQALNSSEGDGEVIVKQVVSLGLKIDDVVVQPVSVMI